MRSNAAEATSLAAIIALYAGIIFVALLLAPTLLWLLWGWLVPYFFPALDPKFASPPFWHVVGVYYLLVVIFSVIRSTVTVKKDD